MASHDAVGFTGTEEDSRKRIGGIEVRSHFCKQVCEPLWQRGAEDRRDCGG
jgi:hypothetical protein